MIVRYTDKYLMSIKKGDMLRKGALAMQLVGQEMLSAGGSENFKMFYWQEQK